jgi:hypothetical protein
LLTKPVELDMNFQGNCMISGEGGHIGTAYNGTVTLCRPDVQGGISLWETGMATCTTTTGTGAALVYVKGTIPSLDCRIYAEAIFNKQ